MSIGFILEREKEIETTWKGKYQSMDNTKIGKESGYSCQKNEEISGRKAYTNIYSLLIEKEIFDHRNISISNLCAGALTN